MSIKKLKLSALAGALVLSTGAIALPITTDIVSVVDESGSMGGEHAWLSGMISDLDAALVTAAGADTLSAQYGLVGFGGSTNGSHYLGHVHDMDAGTAGIQEWGTSGQYGTATGTLTLSGGIEDGYSGIDTALNMTGQTNSVRNVILVTDEDRDNRTSHDYASMAADLATDQALLNAVLRVSIECGDGSAALGVDSEGTGYKADGAGGFTTCENAFQASGYGTSIADYGNLALATGGAVWDLQKLRAGGLTATSFTAAFVDVKIQETIDIIVNVAEPGTFALMGLGIVGLAASRRRKAKTA